MKRGEWQHMDYKKLLRKASSLFLVIIMNMLFAATFPLGKLGLQYSGPLLLSGLRMAIAGGLLLLYYVCSRRRMQSIAPYDRFLFIKVLMFYNLLAYVLEFWALQYMSSLKTNMLWSLLPFVSAFLGFSLLNERLTNWKWIGLFIGTMGMIPIMLLPDESSLVFGEFFSVSLPEFAMLVEVVSYAYGGYLMKRLVDRGYPFVLVNGATLCAAGCILLCVRCLMLPLQPVLTNDWGMTCWYAVLLALASDVAGYGIYGILMHRRYTITFLSFSGFLCPIFGAWFSKYIFNEKLSYHYVISFVLILLGLSLFYRQELEQELNLSDSENS